MPANTAGSSNDSWLRRELIEIGETVVNSAFGGDPPLDATQQVEAAEQALFDLSAKGSSDGGFISFERALTGAIDSAETAFGRAGGVSGCPPGCVTSTSALAGCIRPTC